MENAKRDSGIEAIGDVPWGTHFCLFYKTGDDLSDILVSFFKAGVRNNEFCMCVTADPVNAEEMRKLVGSEMPDFEDYVSKGQIEVIPYTEWYLIDGVFDHERVLEGWNEKLRRAHEKGFAGARVTGNTFWLDKPIWKDFLEYEQAVDGAIDGRNFLVLCTYSLDRCDANEIIDVVSAHQFALARRDGEWNVIENRELKETREALRESEEKLRSFFDLPLIGMALTAPEKGWIYANDRICEILGYSREELFRLTWDKITHPDDLDNDLGHFNRLLRGEIDSYTIEKRFIRKDGMIVDTQISIGCVYNPDKSVRYIAGLMQDITERKRAEEELKAAKRQAELYVDLMGHDINNLHQIALGYLELARDMPAGTEQAMFLDKPVEVLQRSAKLISNVRKLQKLHDGMFQTQDIDVCKVLVDVQRECGVMPNKMVALSINGLERCHVRANELLHDVFANLVNNAIKHTGDHADIVIDLDVVKDDGGRYCRVMVEDDGPGIPDDFKAKIFNRMLEGQDKAKGMGLGLYLVKSLVDSYGGKVWVEDRVIGDHSKGARFVVMLPAVEK